MDWREKLGWTLVAFQVFLIFALPVGIVATSFWSFVQFLDEVQR